MEVRQIIIFIYLFVIYQNSNAQSEKVLFEGMYISKSEYIQKQHGNLSFKSDSSLQKPIAVYNNIGTMINFDEITAPCLFVEQTLPGNTYLQQGLTFSGTWEILNRCGSFSVSNFSTPNFLAWNTDVTSNVESLIFTSPVKNVSFGLASNYGFNINIKLFNVNSEVIGNINTSISGTLTYINFAQENIKRIEITVENNGNYTAGILDNLYFTKQCSTENLTLFSPTDDYYDGSQLKKAQNIIASNLIQGNSTNIVYKAEKSITLTSGFQVKSGSIFKSEIENCY